MTQRTTLRQRKYRELAAFLFLALVLAPVFTVLSVAGYGFCAWMYRVIVSPSAG